VNIWQKSQIFDENLNPMDMHTSIMCINILQNIKAVAPMAVARVWMKWGKFRQILKKRIFYLLSKVTLAVSNVRHLPHLLPLRYGHGSKTVGGDTDRPCIYIWTDEQNDKSNYLSFWEYLKKIKILCDKESRGILIYPCPFVRPDIDTWIVRLSPPTVLELQLNIL
jgi:hypothetical protein